MEEQLFADAPTTKQYPREMYYRLLAGTVLPRQLNRILYLDPDILVINPLRPLWELDLGTHLFAAAAHTGKTGIMHKLDDVLTGAVKTTGARKDKGTLVQLAGTKTGTSATDNSIYDQLKSISTLISSLETRYEKQQDRYWKQFSNLETMMGSLNSQTSYIQQLMQF